MHKRYKLTKTGLIEECDGEVQKKKKKMKVGYNLLN